MLLALLASGAGCAGGGRGADPGTTRSGGGDGDAPDLPAVVGPAGGRVHRLFFGVSGDARPSRCNEHGDYPSAILDSIFDRLDAAGVQFSMDLGDHMFVCQNGSQAEATAQMALYLASARRLSKPTYLTLGNHDCVSLANPRLCGVAGFTTPNFRAFMDALARLHRATRPYYRFDVGTDLGLARFIVVADDAWSAEQEDWLAATLAEADASARYVLVFRHHPDDNADRPEFAAIRAVLAGSRRRTLTFAGHAHAFYRDLRNDPSGRTVVVGNAGAPLGPGATWYGYATVEQRDSGELVLRAYDQQSGNQMAAFPVAPR